MSEIEIYTFVHMALTARGSQIFTGPLCPEGAYVCFLSHLSTQHRKYALVRLDRHLNPVKRATQFSTRLITPEDSQATSSDGETDEDDDSSEEEQDHDSED